jgi:hypothetical protein
MKNNNHLKGMRITGAYWRRYWRVRAWQPGRETYGRHHLTLRQQNGCEARA